MWFLQRLFAFGTFWWHLRVLYCSRLSWKTNLYQLITFISELHIKISDEVSQIPTGVLNYWTKRPDEWTHGKQYVGLCMHILWRQLRSHSEKKNCLLPWSHSNDENQLTARRGTLSADPHCYAIQEVNHFSPWVSKPLAFPCAYYCPDVLYNNLIMLTAIFTCPTFAKWTFPNSFILSSSPGHSKDVGVSCMKLLGQQKETDKRGEKERERKSGKDEEWLRDRA